MGRSILLLVSLVVLVGAVHAKHQKAPLSPSANADWNIPEYSEAPSAQAYQQASAAWTVMPQLFMLICMIVVKNYF
ncbi:hypothetical protein HHI36_012251 [Cryptolaemus montrouzieri]|uniref:Uncharacterized protein n=1 Tax=Cryptolaemus montrouzieri TaxID=559131 RepID=A0ABD2NEE0_9CUCU